VWAFIGVLCCSLLLASAVDTSSSSGESTAASALGEAEARVERTAAVASAAAEQTAELEAKLAALEQDEEEEEEEHEDEDEQEDALEDEAETEAEGEAEDEDEIDEDDEQADEADEESESEDEMEESNSLESWEVRFASTDADKDKDGKATTSATATDAKKKKKKTMPSPCQPRVPTCKDGKKPYTNFEKVATTDGCLALSTMVKLGRGATGARMERCCKKHNKCYARKNIELDSTTIISFDAAIKEHCDEQLGTCLKKKCRKLRGEDRIEKCLDLSFEAWRNVREKGCFDYEAQRLTYGCK